MDGIHDHGGPHDGHDDTMHTMSSFEKDSSWPSCHPPSHKASADRRCSSVGGRDYREWTVTVSGGVLGFLLWTSPLSAQSMFSQRVAVEFASAITTSSTTPADPFVVFDATATVRMTGTLDVIVRPWVRRLPGGDWAKEV